MLYVEKIITERTNFFSVFVLMSRARVKKASSTLAPVFALVSKNLMPCSTANRSPRSLVTCNPKSIRKRNNLSSRYKKKSKNLSSIF